MTLPPLRVGQGVDAHPLVAGRPLVLGGVRVPFELGLDGHSDADVVAHAACDAVLGAAGLPDLGRHFPSADPRLEGRLQHGAVRRVAGLVAASGWAVVNLDVAVLCDRPRLGHLIRRRWRPTWPPPSAWAGRGPGHRQGHRRPRLLRPGRGIAATAVCLAAEQPVRG